MYQVFVVEDELLIRQNIRRQVERLGGRFSFCGEASDGEMALSVIQDVMPDILLTDIRMPFLDGFDLIRHARAIMPWLKVVIISGFDEFEYARKAISLGVNSYLLKPVNANDLSEELGKLADEIEADRRKQASAAGYNAEEIGDILKQNFVRQIFAGQSDTGKLLDRAGTLGLDIVRTHYQAVVFSFDYSGNGLYELISRVMAAQDISMYCFAPPRTLSVLFCENGQQALSDRVYRFIGILRHEMSLTCSAVTVVTSPVAERLSMISSVYHAASDLLEKAKLVMPGQVIDAQDTAQLAMGFMDQQEPFGIDFKRRLARADENEIENLLDSALASDKRPDTELMRFYSLLSLLKACADIICTKTNEGDYRDVAARLSSECDINIGLCGKEDFRSTALRLMRMAADSRGSKTPQNKHYHVISRAIEYVQNNFCDPNITLISVAGHVGMSTAHFSTVFSQSMGKSFIAYLTKLRIEKAKELLVKTDMKLSDVAMEIGYNEPNYFSHVFRKSEGVTPKEYRNNPSGQ